MRQPQRQRVFEAVQHLRQLSELFELRKRQLASAVGLTEQQWSVLEGISTEHFMPTLFARAQATSTAAVSKVLRQLLDRGLVSVSVSPDDGRQRNYALTEEGQCIVERLRKLREDALCAVWQPLEASQVDNFNRFSKRLIPLLEGYVGKQHMENEDE